MAKKQTQKKRVPRKALTPEEAAARAKAKLKTHVRAAQDHAAPVITVVHRNGKKERIIIRKVEDQDNG
jgi:hypothetical protein